MYTGVIRRTLRDEYVQLKPAYQGSPMQRLGTVIDTGVHEIFWMLSLIRRAPSIFNKLRVSEARNFSLAVDVQPVLDHAPKHRYVHGGPCPNPPGSGENKFEGKQASRNSLRSCLSTPIH